MTDKEKTIKELKEALDSLDITNKYRLNLIRAIEYLQEEPVSEELEKVVEEIVDPTVLNAYGVKEIANRLRRTMIEPVSEDLEEVSKQYALNNTPYEDCADEIQEAVKYGAKWQKNQLPKWRRLPLSDVSYTPDYWCVMNVVTSTVNGNSTSVSALVKGNYYVPLFELEKLIMKED